MSLVPRTLATPAGPFRNPSNRFSLDYRAEARLFPSPPVGIVDVHTHVNGGRAAVLMREAMDLYGIERVWSMTALEQVDAVRAALGDRLELIAIPDWAAQDRRHANGPGFLENIRRFHDLGARIVKFWAAPRAIDYGHEAGDPGLLRLDSPDRLRAMELADSLDMTFMVHVADPDTWFSTRYRDAGRYGTKRSHYEPFEALLERFRHRRWMAAHLGGWPEDLGFLDGLLARHPNLVLDSSATKWMVREISRHPREAVVAFLRRHRGRILFGSDIVTTDDHLRPGEGKTEMQAKADSAEDAFDLYASRYWALRSMWEADGEAESPIGDPDLAMVAPDRHGPHDAPTLRGFALPEDLLQTFYRDAAESLLPRR